MNDPGTLPQPEPNLHSDMLIALAAQRVGLTGHEFVRKYGEWTEKDNATQEQMERAVYAAVAIVAGAISAAPPFREPQAPQNAPPGWTFPYGVPLDLRNAVETDVPDLDFVLHGLMRRYTAGLIAPGGTGKSYLSLGIAAEVATGSLYREIGLVRTGAVPRRVVVLSAEEDAAMLRFRMHAFGAHLAPEARELFYANVVLISLLGNVPTLMTAKLEVNEEAVGHIIALVKGAGLVVFDPLRKFHDGNENQSADMTVVTKIMDRIAVHADCAALFVHHATKDATYNGSGGEAGAARGSGAITDNIRLQLNLSRLTDKQCKEYGVGSNEAKWFVALDFAKANHVAPEGTRILRRRLDGTLYHDEEIENQRDLEREHKTHVRNRATTLASNGSGDAEELPTLEEYVDAL